MRRKAATRYDPGFGRAAPTSRVGQHQTRNGHSFGSRCGSFKRVLTVFSFSMVRRLQPRPERHSVSSGTTPRSLIPIGMTTLLPNAAERVRHLDARYSRGLPDGVIAKSSRRPLNTWTCFLPGCRPIFSKSVTRSPIGRPDASGPSSRRDRADCENCGDGDGRATTSLRLSYRSTVFRYEPEHAGREREVFQLGVRTDRGPTTRRWMPKS